MTIDPYARYYVVTPGSFLETSLSRMEKAAEHFELNYKSLIAENNKFFTNTVNDQIKAITVISAERLGHMPMVVQGTEAVFRATAAKVLKPDYFDVIIPVLAPLGESTDNHPNVARGTQLKASILTLGTERNWFSTLAAIKGASKIEDAKKAVLLLNGKPIYPEAYQVFSDWVVKMPPVLPHYGNDFEPPDCIPISVDQLAKMTSGCNLTDFRHDHATIRQRLTSFHKIEMKGLTV